MSYLTKLWDLAVRQLSEALLKQLRTDLVSCLVYNIKEAKIPGWASTLFELDVYGTFDPEQHSRLIWQMQKQRWPISILRRTSSLLRRCRVKGHFQVRRGKSKGAGNWGAQIITYLPSRVLTLYGGVKEKRKYLWKFQLYWLYWYITIG